MQNYQIFQTIHPEIIHICKAISAAQGVSKSKPKAYLVGGCVRDEFFRLFHGMTFNSKDIDIEVFGISEATLLEVLQRFGYVKETGKFKVLKLTTTNGEYDFNLPRTEIKTGDGHNDYDVTIDPTLSLELAAMRRDITINAIYYCPLKKVVVDPFGGIIDVLNRVCKHTSEKFAEDALRVLRVMQFIARFDLTVGLPTIMLCNSLLPEASKLDKERIQEEFTKLCEKGVHISRGFIFLLKCGWHEAFPQLQYLCDKKLYMDACMKLDMVAKGNVNRIPEARLVLMLNAMCFHMGNPAAFLKQINATNKVTSEVMELLDITRSLYFTVYDADGLYVVKQLLAKIKHTSRYMVREFLTAIRWDKKEFLQLDSQITDESITRRVTGDDLVALGWTQGKELGAELERLFKLQLKFNTPKEVLLVLVTSK